MVAMLHLLAVYMPYCIGIMWDHTMHGLSWHIMFFVMLCLNLLPVCVCVCVCVCMCAHVCLFSSKA